MTDSPQSKEVVFIGIEIIRFLTPDVPGFVECRLTDIHEREHIFHENIVTTARIWSDTEFPQPGFIAGVESVAGESRFLISPDQIEP